MLSVLSSCKPVIQKATPTVKQAVEEAQTSANEILSNTKLETRAASVYEDVDTLYYAKDEIQLAKIIQYQLENEKTAATYQSDRELDLNETAQILSFINPFDLSLTQNATELMDANQQLLYRSYHITLTNLDERYVEAQSKAKSVVAQRIDASMSLDEKIAEIHDYIVREAVYDETIIQQGITNNSIFKVAGVLIDKKAVCTGYARAFMMLAAYAKVPALYVSSDSINHGWNLVYGDHGWRYIDTTWDDPLPDTPSVVVDTFLNMGIQAFLKEGKHVFDPTKPSSYYLNLGKTFYDLHTIQYE